MNWLCIFLTNPFSDNSRRVTLVVCVYRYFINPRTWKFASVAKILNWNFSWILNISDFIFYFSCLFSYFFRCMCEFQSAVHALSVVPWVAFSWWNSHLVQQRLGEIYDWSGLTFLARLPLKNRIFGYMFGKYLENIKRKEAW